jgi:periplasmic mercuric ion binding protein
MRLLSIIAFLLVATISNAQKSSIVTVTLSVQGNCEECKERIENAADVKGVKRCKWNPDTDVATVIYDTKKTDLLTIEKAIAAIGHDTQNAKANETVYNNLPDCCQYRTKVCNEKKK